MIWFLVLSLATHAMAQNFSCNTDAMDWYTQTIGETPCETYSRLRQICNPSYNISSLQSIFGSTPDYCTDEISRFLYHWTSGGLTFTILYPADCCCNSASFVLSMLCRNCQFTSGHTAFTGAYDIYLNKSGSTCSPNTNGSLPDHIQTAVCDNNIKIMNAIYTDYSPDGSWQYGSAIGTLTKELGDNNGKVITKCGGDASTSSASADGSTTASGSSSSSSNTLSVSVSSSTSPPGSSSAALSTGAAVGIAVCATMFGLLLIGGIAIILWRRKQKNKSIGLVDTVQETTEIANTPTTISPFIVASSANQTTDDSGPNRHSQAPQSALPASKSLSRLHPLSPNSADSSSSALSPRSPMRHVDAGPVEGLPPAYGDQIDEGVRRT